MLKFYKIKICFLPFILLSMVNGLSALDANWISTSSSDLNLGSNWSSGTVPNGKASFDNQTPSSVILSPTANAPFSIGEINFVNSASAFNFNFNSASSSLPALKFTGTGVTGVETDTNFTVTNSSGLVNVPQVIFSTGSTTLSATMGSASISASNNLGIQGINIGQIVLGNQKISPTGPIFAGDNATLSASNNKSMTSATSVGQIELLGTNFTARDNLNVLANNQSTLSCNNLDLEAGQLIIDGIGDSAFFTVGDNASFNLANSLGGFILGDVLNGNVNAGQIVIIGRSLNTKTASLASGKNTTYNLSNVGQIKGSYLAGQIVLNGNIGAASLETGSGANLTLENINGGVINCVNEGGPLVAGQIALDSHLGNVLLHLGNQSTSSLMNDSTSLITSTGIDAGQLVLCFDGNGTNTATLTLDDGAILNVINEGAITKSSLVDGFAAQIIFDGNNASSGQLTLNSGANVVIAATNAATGQITNAGSTLASQMYFRNAVINGNVTLKAVNEQTSRNIEGIIFDGSSSGDNVHIQLENSTLVVDTNESFTIASLSGDANSVCRLNNDLVINTENGNSSDFSGVISDMAAPRNLIISGAGTQILSGNNTFTGNTTINQGQLVLNGMLAKDVIVNGGIFSGNGRVNGNLTVNSGGKISPGNSVGIIQVAGNYTQNPNSIFIVEINDSFQSDLIDISGNAALNGGTVEVIVLGGYNPDFKYLILEATGGVNGVFQNVVASSISGLFEPFLIYTPSQVFLEIQTAISNGACSPNTLAVASVFDRLANRSPDVVNIINALIELNASDVCSALNEMTGQQYALAFNAVETSGRQFLRRLYDPLRQIVTSNQCTSKQCNCSCDLILTPWVNVGGGQTKLQGNHDIKGLKINEWDLSCGFQGTKDVWTFGLAGSYEQDQIHYNLNGNGHANTGYAAVYGLYRPKCWYALADVVYGYTHNRLKRNLNINTLHYQARGKYHIDQLIGYVESGFDLFFNSFLFQPFVGFEGGYYHRDKINEKGTSPLNLIINSKNFSNAYGRLGFHLKANPNFNLCSSFPKISAFLDLAFVYRLKNRPRNNIDESFSSFGNSFTIHGMNHGRFGVDTALTFAADFCDRWQLYVEALGTYWTKSSNYNLNAGVNYFW